MAIDFGASLDKILETYSKVSEVRAAKDVAKYQAAGARQQALLDLPQGYTASEAYATGNAPNPAYMMPNNLGASASMQVPKEVIYGGLGLAALFVAWKVLQ